MSRTAKVPPPGEGSAPGPAAPPRTDGIVVDETVFDSISDPVVRRVTVEGPITSVNHAAEQAYGWTRSELQEIRVGDPLRTEYPSSLAGIRADLRRDGWWEGRLVRHTKDGRPVAVSSRWVRAAHPNGER
ncbi:MAG: PAS domain-containing protein, partial [Candidatus Dormibacteraeota bacterium]|nr:PAS domain-containing protein [Candidatus Dormibacteraeota bacterium]